MPTYHGLNGHVGKLSSQPTCRHVIDGDWRFGPSPVEDVDVERACSLCLGEVFHVHHTIFQEKVSRLTAALIERVPSYLRRLGGRGDDVEILFWR